MEELITGSSVSAILGTLAPFVFPFVFKLFKKFANRELTSQEKRYTVMGTAIATGIVVVASTFQFADGTILERVLEFGSYLFVNFIAFKGMVQTVYTVLNNSLHTLDEKIESM